MISNDTASVGTGKSLPAGLFDLLLVALCLVALGLIFQDGLSLMVRWWERDEYSHGYMIPLVAGFLLWQKLPALAQSGLRPAWAGAVLMLVAVLVWSMGEISSLYTIVQYGFLLAIYALALALLGWRGSWLVAAALAYLLFMIPLPQFLYANLSQKLQLISSDLGVWVVRLFGISVYLEGNVIDLGTYKLQVVEACSGLRYLFPLMSFGFLIAAVYRGPWWHRLVIFLVTIPITVLMNSFRIGVIGITVDRWGNQAAEGFLHDFEGWVVFMACLAVLLLVVWLLNVLSGHRRSLWDRIDLSYPTWGEVKAAWAARPAAAGINGPLLAATLIVVLAVPFSFMVTGRAEAPPARDAFLRFPLIHNGWVGRDGALEADVLNTLKLTDYIQAQYRTSGDSLPVSFYVAYYDSQRKGASIHSPRSCLPGGGWVIQESAVQPLPQPAGGVPDLKVNRVVIQQGESRQLVYYWFQGRGRVITNEFAAKWYIFQDALTRNRTDGALVRLITQVPSGTDIALADQRLRAFAADFGPLLGRYIPQ